MKLIESLASGITLAAVGTAILNSRGTSTRAQYYRDFEASQVYTAQPIALDSSGSAVVYVNELVDVLVYDASGTLVREFVAGDSAPAVEVISRSFTGTSYSDGSSGASKPTTLQAVLDKWLASAGTTDFNVIPTGGTSITLAAATAALQGLFFNVKTYGAIGNGSADDSAAIAAAYAAAAATASGGGFVFFPPGLYRSAASIAVAGGVGTMGSGGGGSKLLFDGAAIGFSIASTSALTVVKDMFFGCQTTANASDIVDVTGTGRVHFVDCQFGGNNAAAEQGRLVGVSTSASVNSETTFERCKFLSLSSSSSQYQLAAFSGGVGLVRAVSCDFVSGPASNGVQSIVCADGMEVIGCRFDSSAIAALASVYITYSASASSYMAPIVIGCFFGANSSFPPTALFNQLATPNKDFIEYGNTFGGIAALAGGSIITPYSNATDGYAPLAATPTSGFRGSRLQLRESFTSAATINANPKVYGATVIAQTAGVAIALNATLGSPGDMWTLIVHNIAIGAPITVTPNAANITLDASAATFTVGNNSRRMLVFEWLPVLTGVGTGRWVQVATSTNV